MSQRKLPRSFVCEGCSEVVTLALSPTVDHRRRYCSSACKLRTWRLRNGDIRRAVCKECGTAFSSNGQKTYCSDDCKTRGAEKHQKRVRHLVFIACLQCGKSFPRRLRATQVTCSVVCGSIRRREQLRGKKYRPARAYERSCAQCNKPFICRQKQITVCAICTKRGQRRGRRHYRERCRRAGVPYVAAVTPEKVFARDGYRCHLCGRKTPKRLRGKNVPASPELDHIVPINAQGSPGHVWTNVACACRQCNMSKGVRPIGQLRLAV